MSDEDSRSGGKKRSSGVFCVIAFALLFLAFFIPVYSDYFRAFFSQWGNTLWDMIGGFCLLIGGIYTVLGIIGLFVRWRGTMKMLFYGIVLLWIGCCITGAALPLLDLLPGFSQPESGYY